MNFGVLKTEYSVNGTSEHVVTHISKELDSILYNNNNNYIETFYIMIHTRKKNCTVITVTLKRVGGQ